MSAALYIVLEEVDPGFDTFVNGKSLSDKEDELNAIACDLNVTPLMQFYSTDTEEAIELMEFEGDPSDAAIPQTQWFEPSDGLKTVQALQRFIVEHCDQISEANAIKSDLSEFENVLVQAQEHGLRWHLSVDY